MGLGISAFSGSVAFYLACGSTGGLNAKQSWEDVLSLGEQQVRVGAYLSAF